MVGVRVIETSRGTMRVAGTDAPRIAREEASRLKEIVNVRLGQQHLYFVGPDGRLSSRQALLYRIERLRQQLSECAKVAQNLREQDIVDALFAAEVQFEDLETVTP